MDYSKVYNLLCERGQKTRNCSEYVERHHIIPKCMGGDDSIHNITTLTYREHYIAHLLLTKIYPEHRGVNYALLCMIRKQPTGERIYNSRIFETVKRKFSKFKRLYCTIQNPGKTDNARIAAKNRMNDPKRNPISIDPSKNRTCQPIRVYFDNGTSREYTYAKAFCLDQGISYSTMKYWLRVSGGKSTKHGICKIERIEKFEG